MATVTEATPSRLPVTDRPLLEGQEDENSTEGDIGVETGEG